MARFTWNPSFGAQAAREPRIRSARFGDGYEQRAASGLNADLATWSLTFENRSDADAASITAFLAARGGHEAFEWIAPGDTVTVTDHGFGVGDGTTTAFQLQATKNGEWSDVLGTWPTYTKPRKNLCLRSQEFDSVGWTKTRATVITNCAQAPDGTPTADKLVEDTTATATHDTYSSVNVPGGQPVTGSVYVKAAERSWIRLTLTAAFSANPTCYFDLANGVLGGTGATNGTARITPVGNGWYRCELTGTTALGGGASALVVNLATGNGSGSYTGDGSSGVLVWGAQYELGATATRYIPTTTTSVTVNPSYWPASGDGFEPITEPAPGITLYKDGVALVQGADWTLGAKGVVIFYVAPAYGAVLSWTGTGAWVKKWVCRKWRRSVPNYGVATITADFEQVPA